MHYIYATCDIQSLCLLLYSVSLRALQMIQESDEHYTALAATLDSNFDEAVVLITDVQESVVQVHLEQRATREALRTLHNKHDMVRLETSCAHLGYILSTS